MAPVNHSRAEVKLGARNDEPNDKRRTNPQVAPAHENQPHTRTLRKAVRNSTSTKPHTNLWALKTSKPKAETSPRSPNGQIRPPAFTRDDARPSPSDSHDLPPTTHARDMRCVRWLRAGSARDHEMAQHTRASDDRAAEDGCEEGTSERGLPQGMREGQRTGVAM